MELKMTRTLAHVYLGVLRVYFLIQKNYNSIVRFPAPHQDHVLATFLGLGHQELPLLFQTKRNALCEALKALVE